MSRIEIDVVIPVYKKYEQFIQLYESFRYQKKVKVANVVVPLTIDINDNKTLKFKKYLKEKRIKFFEVQKNDFSHSLVRETAVFSYCKNNFVILLTQDAKLISQHSMYNLIKNIDDDIIYTFGRQICTKKRCIEKYIRDFNYPKQSYISSKKSIKGKQIKAFFASDVFAGLNRKAFIQLGGYDGLNLPTNEDMLYMYKLIMKGYKAKYCADAIVEHYHLYNLKSLYIRYYNSGVFFKTVNVFNSFKKNDSGKKLAFYVLKESIKHFDLITLLRWFPNMLIRYIAIKRGMKM